ncbi:MAG: hypothetical protein PVJ09_03725 [Candidatus Woesebacteria bacterium]|jgi:hypothetical protein
MGESEALKITEDQKSRARALMIVRWRNLRRWLKNNRFDGAPDKLDSQVRADLAEEFSNLEEALGEPRPRKDGHQVPDSGVMGKDY